MNRQEICSRIAEIGIMPSVRVPEAELALFAAETVYEAGIPVVEITMTVPNAVEVIAQLSQNFPSFVVGAGTVLDAETAERCLAAGASLSPARDSSRRCSNTRSVIMLSPFPER
jgi:2-dehydro-3-deoxyphosphogluconate aldolase/(4S)-4-hydroxy-2-oxoglutarate aldolase